MSSIEKLLWPYRNIIVGGIHLISAIFSYFCAFYIRFECSVPSQYFTLFYLSLPLLVLSRMTSYLFFRTIYVSFSFADLKDDWDLLKAQVIGTILFILLLVIFSNIYGFPRSVIILELIFSVLILKLIRLVRKYSIENRGNAVSQGKKHSIIVGAGKAGVLALNEIKSNADMGITVVGFVDDNPYKSKSVIQGVPVLGKTTDLPSLIEKYRVDEVLVAIPSAPYKDIMNITNIVKKSNVKVGVLPGLDKLIKGVPIMGQVADISLYKLMGRKMIKFSRDADRKLLEGDIKGKIVLVTGAGGSIGAEICMQLAELNPKLIIAYERHENSLYDFEIAFKKRFPNQSLLPVIGDIRDLNKLDRIIMEENVKIIYHAAAYKHVPMMEREPIEAVKNNIFGTYILAGLSKRNHVDKFIFISTDKAVNPTSIMGTTKRVAELLLQALNNEKTKFISVRFGNVLESNGSVIPLFRKQILEGGPVTVTHKDVDRYFMAIPEAVQLVLTAGAMGKGGEIFLLDMGKPIKIFDLAKHLIKQSGMEPGKDIEIVITGLRKGEKLHEELYWIGEGILLTENKKITMLKPPDGTNDSKKLLSEIHKLNDYIANRDSNNIIRLLNEVVPEATINDLNLEQGDVS